MSSIPQALSQLSSAIQKGVRTPLVFYILAFFGMLVFSSIMGKADILPEVKARLFYLGFCFLVGIVVFVSCCVWFRRRDLVYGGEEQLEERKMEFGTDGRILSVEGIEALAAITKPETIPGDS